MAEVEVQPDQTGNVIRVVAALDDPQARRVEVGGRAVQGDTQLMPALGHRNRLLVFEVGGFVAIIGVQRQIVDGVFLALGPQAFAAHIDAHR